MDEPEQTVERLIHAKNPATMARAIESCYKIIELKKQQMVTLRELIVSLKVGRAVALAGH